MTLNKPRPLVICVFKNGNKILADMGYDKANKKNFFRPLGGGIEFGEHSADALKREIKEELGVEITDLKKLGVMENIFEYEGAVGHEILVVYDARFVDEDIYKKDKIAWVEDDGKRSEANWVGLQDVKDKKITLYPEGLIDLLTK